MSLPSDEFGSLGGGKRGPSWLQVVASERSIGLAVVSWVPAQNDKDLVGKWGRER